MQHDPPAAATASADVNAALMGRVRDVVAGNCSGDDEETETADAIARMIAAGRELYAS